MTPVASCTHRVQHYHGTHTAYGTCSCRCDACRHANSTHRKARIHLLRGQVTVPADRAKDHVRGLLAAGMNKAEIARQARMDHQSLLWLLTKTSRVSRDTERRILAVKLGVTAVGVQRRLRALQAVGWTCAEMGARLGISLSGTSQIMNGSRVPLGTSRFRESVPAVYEAMWRGPEHPSERVMARARRKGWAPPMAWDDDTIDDARVKPRGVEPMEMSIDALVENLLDMAASFRSWNEAVERVGYRHHPTLERRLRRHRQWDRVHAAFGLGVAA